MVFLFTTLVGSLICGLFLYGRSFTKNFYFIVVWWKTKDQKEKKNQEKFYLGIFADLKNIKITHKHNYKLHNTKFLFKITQYIYSYHSCIYQYFYRVSYKTLPTGINYRKKIMSYKQICL